MNLNKLLVIPFLLSIFVIAGCEVDELGVDEPGVGGLGGGGLGNYTLRVVSTLPADGAANVSLDSNIQATLDSSIDPALLSNFSVSFTDGINNVTGVLTVNGDVFTFDPDSELEYSTTYNLVISDSAGNTLDTPYPWSFTTKPEFICADHYQQSFTLISGQDEQDPSALSKPDKGVPYTDPAYGTCVVRATNHNQEGPRPDTGNFSNLMRNDYSRRNPFNANNSMYFVYARGGVWHLYDANTLDYIRVIPGVGGDAEPVWHPTDPDVLYYLPTNGGTKVFAYDYSTNSSTTAADFTNRLPWGNDIHAWTKSEGAPSADGRYWAFMVDSSSFQGLGMFTYDMQTDTIIATYDFASNSRPRPDHLTMSPTGDYVVVSWADGTYMLNRNLTTSSLIFGSGQHSDLALNSEGEDVFVWSHYSNDFPSEHSGWVVAYNLHTGEYFRLWLIYDAGSSTSMHISGRAFNRPGWVLVSTYNPYAGNDRWYNNKLMAVELKPNPTILNIAHTYNDQDDYWSESQAAVNNDFTRILFNTNWQNPGNEDVDAYMVVLPSNVIIPDAP